MYASSLLPETNIPFPLASITVVVGHYGVGKTNLSLNLAYDSAQAGAQVTLIDLDVVNPYFRSSDHGAALAEAGICLIAPNHAGSALDVPSLSGAIMPALNRANEEHLVIVDAGGDEVGATALGRFSDAIAAKAHTVLYVINAYRNQTQTPEEVVQLLYDIEAKAKLTARGMVNNSHLKQETSYATIEASLQFAKESARRAGIPLLATTVPRTLFEGYRDKETSLGNAEPKSSGDLPSPPSQNLYCVQVYVRAPWES